MGAYPIWEESSAKIIKPGGGFDLQSFSRIRSLSPLADFEGGNIITVTQCCTGALYILDKAILPNGQTDKTSLYFRPGKKAIPLVVFSASQEG